VNARSRWALLGKLPGDQADYRILRGGPGDPGDLAAQIRAAIPGTPQLGSLPGPGTLPWVTFVPSRDAAGRAWLGVAVIEATADRDLAGRPNFAVRYVSVPYSLLSARRVGYQALHAAVAAADLPGQGEQVDLALPPGPDGIPAATLADPALFATAAGIAGLALCGDVVITLSSSPPCPLMARLAEFDRVAALLPFGMRAGIGLATWDDGTADGTFRLAYGPFAAHDQTAVTNDADLPRPPGPPGSDYRQALERLRDRAGLSLLTEYLAEHRDPLGPDDGPQATDILRSLGEPGLVVDAVRTGRASVDRVAATRRFAGKVLDQDSRDALEAYLMARYSDDRAAREVHALWSDRSAVVAARLALRQVAARQPGAGAGARGLLGLAVGHHEAESFLAELAAGGLSQAGTVIPASDLARLLSDLVKPVPGKLPAVRRVLLQRPDVSRWILRGSLDDAATGQSWLDWLRWLDPGDAAAPGWMWPYAQAACFEASLRMADSRSLADADPEDLALAARIACHADRANPLAEDWWPSLLRLTQQVTTISAGAQADLSALVTEIGDLSAELVAATRVDTLRLYLRQPPRFYPTAGSADRCRGYLNELWQLWSSGLLAADAAALAARLLAAVLAEPDGPGRAAVARRRSPFGEPAIALLTAVVQDGRIPLDAAVVDVIAGVCAAAPDLLDDPRLTATWWARVESLRPGLRGPVARLRAAVRQPGADPVEIAVLWGRAAAGGLAPDELLAVIAPWLATRAPKETSAMLRILGEVISLCERDRADADDYVLAVARELTSGPLGTEPATAYAAYEANRIQAEAALGRRLEQAIKTAVPGKGHPRIMRGLNRPRDPGDQDVDGGSVPRPG
jgi:hypothetical protein